MMYAIDMIWPTSHITLVCISFIFIGMKFIHCHSCMMLKMNFIRICNDLMNHDEIIILLSLIFRLIF